MTSPRGRLSPTSQIALATADQLEDSIVLSLFQECGFSRDQASAALHFTGNSVESTVDHLLQEGVLTKDVLLANTKKLLAALLKLRDSGVSPPPPIQRDESGPSLYKPQPVGPQSLDSPKGAPSRPTPVRPGTGAGGQLRSSPIRRVPRSGNASPSLAPRGRGGGGGGGGGQPQRPVTPPMANGFSTEEFGSPPLSPTVSPRAAAATAAAAGRPAAIPGLGRAKIPPSIASHGKGPVGGAAGSGGGAQNYMDLSQVNHAIDAARGPVNYSALPESLVPQVKKPVVPRPRVDHYMDGSLDLSYFSWYHGRVTTDDATVLLEGKRKGAFLVRNSRRPMHFVIVWVSNDEGKLVHILISPKDENTKTDGGYKVEGNNRVWPHVPDIIKAWGKRHLTGPVSVRSALVYDKELRSIHQWDEAQPGYEQKKQAALAAAKLKQQKK